MTKPRLLVLTSTFPRWRDDPEPPFVFELSRRLTDRFEITMLAPRSPGSLEQEVMADLRVVRFPYFLRRWETLAGQDGGILNRLRANPLNYLLVPFFLIGQAWALIRLLRAERWDLIHAHWLIPQGVIALFVKKLCRCSVPLICTSHGGDLFALRSAPLQALKRVVMQASAGITVVSEAMRAVVLSMGIAAEKVSVIPMGVDLQQQFTPDPKGTPRQTHELLFVGRLVEKKGVDQLLRALPQILETHPKTGLVIAGGGPLEPDLKRLTETLGLVGRVEFRGMLTQAELPTLYRRATLFVAPFRIGRSGDQEGLGLVLVEASGCGCPVICGNVAAVQDVIESDHSGVLINPDDTEALAAAIVALLSDPQRRERLAVQARARCLERFDWGVIAKRYREQLMQSIESREQHGDLERDNSPG
ncbi:MAG: glycosyltransferase family 4 protein [Halochromatium sp.]|nr:glycosyltransferase family 4 protein [Halochromatium sp.]